MRRLRVLRKADTVDAIDLVLESCDPPPVGADEVLVEVRAAGVNRSDVSATLGRMPQALWPRTPGRDWAGVVVQGPTELVGREVFGAGGDLGITRDGTHASHLVVPLGALVEKPAALTLAEAGSLGVPFVTALEGFRRAGMPRAGDVVLVTAVNGMVGQAAAQIAAMHGARVFGVTRRAEAFVHPVCPVRMIDASSEDVAAVVRGETDGHGADIVYNTVGSPYFAAANRAMAHGGRQIFIATIEREVTFDIFAFYRGRHSFFGVDSLALDATASAALLRELLPAFADGRVRPLPVVGTACYPLERTLEAYHTVHSIARDRVVLLP
jgi:NADPH:quinone reductase-like Zn-dependent oxidoreductase